jgi:alkane 1-monooxygenase
MQSLFYGLGLLLVSLSAYGLHLGGFGLWWGGVFLFLLLPALEFLLPRMEVPEKINFKAWSDTWVWLSPFYLTVFLLFAGFKFFELGSYFEKAALILSVGSLLGTFGITYAHELVHRPREWERALGVWNLLLVNFAFWGVEHVFGHHKNVGTNEDPATARKNQTVYSFWLQNFFYGYGHAWKFESQRLKNSKKSFWRHRIFLYSLFSLALSAGLLSFWGVSALVFWWSVSAVAILLLMTVDYIEHYGLVRIKKETGLYEPVKAAHSWDTRGLLTNLVLTNLGLHSHHHLKARLPFQELQAQTDSRNLPYGYSVMVLVALIPPVYFKLIHPRLEVSSSSKQLSRETL